MSEPVQFGTSDPILIHKEKDYVQFGNASAWDPLYVHKEKRDFEVAYKTEEKIRFRVGKTSFTQSYDPREAHIVTEINSIFDSVVASTLISRLKSCQSSQVVRGIVAYGSQILLQEEVLYHFKEWIQREFNLWSAEGRKVNWFVHINKDNKLLAYFRNYALGLLYLHKKRFYFNSDASDLLITPEGLKIFKISYCPITADFKPLILWNVDQFRILFLSCLTFPIWWGKQFGPDKYTGIGYRQQESLGLSWEVCQAINHFHLASDLDTIPAEALLNHPVFYTPKEKVIVSAKINFELLYQNQKDGIIRKLNEKMKRRKDPWKLKIEINPYINWLVGHCECSRMGCVEEFMTGDYEYEVSAPEEDNHLFGDLCKLFHNAQRHLDKSAIIHKSEATPEDIFLYVEEQIPGGLTKIFGFLLNEFHSEIKSGLDIDIIEKRIKFLKTLL